jgi:hypothetical protein
MTLLIKHIPIHKLRCPKTLQRFLSGTASTDKVSKHFNRVQRTARALGMELHAPDLLPRVCSGFDSLNGRVIAVDKERFPALREWILQGQRVLMVLTKTPD